MHGDICDQALVESTLAEHGIETLVHFAAESHNSLAILDPARFFRTNVLGTQSLCDAARRVGVERFHHISTCEVYGDLALDSDESFSEESPYRPRTPYNASKAGADHVVRCYIETFGLQATITNCCNNYGPYQFPEKVIPLFSTRALEGETPPVVRLDEEPPRMAARRRPLPGDRARLGKGRHRRDLQRRLGQEASIEEIADGVLAAAGQPESLKTIVPDRPGHDRRYLLDSTKLRTELGWEPTVGFASGLAATVGWYRDNRSWWEPLIGRSPVVEASWAQVSPGTKPS